MVRLTEVMQLLYFRRVPTADRCPVSHETLFDPADWQLTLDVLSKITRFLWIFGI